MQLAAFSALLPLPRAVSMNIEEYESSGRARFERLARVVEDILKYALHGFDGVANKPQTQIRAKDVASLKRKLSERGVHDSDSIESAVKDLAGCRIIFYTNTDLERFRQSDIFRRNFAVDWAASKTHFPRNETASVDELYQGIHYVVQLTEDRANLVEYSDLAGLRCEVQLQTILNHAWSETAHDVVYKTHSVDGFGKRQNDAIKERFARVMREHLMPAGYDMQKIQDLVERLRSGLAVFDEEPLEQLGQARDNNEREDYLKKIKEHLLPGLDDVSGHIRNVRKSVIEAIEAARTVPVIAREAPLGQFEGASSKDVLKRGLEILETLHYGYVEEAFGALVRLWKGSSEDDERKLIEDSVEKLAKYNIPVWQKIGAGVQLALIEELNALGADERKLIRPLALKVCRTVLGTDMEGATATSYDTITLSRGTVVLTDALKTVRQNAVAIGIEALENSVTSAEWRTAWSSLWSGTSSGTTGQKSVDLQRAQLDLMRELSLVIQRCRERIPYDVLQAIEEQLYWAHRRLGRRDNDLEQSEKADKDETHVSETRAALVAARDAINGDDRYVKYKTLVGFRTVFVEEWDREIEIAEKERERTRRIEAYADGVTIENRDAWLSVIKQCAETESDDLATFPPLTQFFKALSAKHPSIALDIFVTGGKPLAGFAPSFIPVLVTTNTRADTLKAIQAWIDSSRSLSPLGRALFLCDETFVALIKRVARNVVETRDVRGCVEVAYAALKHGDADNGLLTEVFVPAVDTLTLLENGSFASSWLMSDGLMAKLEELPETPAHSMLRNFVYCREIGYGEQQQLRLLAKRNLEQVWSLFEGRIKEADRHSWEDQYEAVPNYWYGLDKLLRADVSAAFERVIKWPEDEGDRTRWEKTQFLANRDRGEPRGPSPPTPPCIRVRTRRFG